MNRTHLTIFVIVAVILSLFGVYTHFTKPDPVDAGAIYCQGYVDGYEALAEREYGPAPEGFEAEALALCLALKPWLQEES